MTNSGRAPLLVKSSEASSFVQPRQCEDMTPSERVAKKTPVPQDSNTLCERAIVTDCSQVPRNGDGDGTARARKRIDASPDCRRNKQACYCECATPADKRKRTYTHTHTHTPSHQHKVGIAAEGRATNHPDDRKQGKVGSRLTNVHETEMDVRDQQEDESQSEDHGRIGHGVWIDLPAQPRAEPAIRTTFLEGHSPQWNAMNNSARQAERNDEEEENTIRAKEA
jgi:hypothetical protein